MPAREMLADLLLENGAADEALLEYKAVLKTAPRRFNATAGAAHAAAKLGDKLEARAYALALLDISKNAVISRPDSVWARNYIASR